MFEWLFSLFRGNPQRTVWTTHVLQALRRYGAAGFPADLPRAEVDRILAATFPVGTVVVQESMLGFRIRPNLLILLVEVVSENGDGCETHVVKVGEHGTLLEEWQGWARVFPSFTGDPVLMGLRCGYPADDSRPGRFRSLVYQNARGWIGEGDTSSVSRLEKEVLNAVYFGCPAATGLHSAETAISLLLGRLDAQLYQLGQLRPLLDAISSVGASLPPPTPPPGDRDAPGLEKLPNLDKVLKALDEWDKKPEFRNLRAHIDKTIRRMKDPNDLDHPVRRYLGVVPFLKLVRDRLLKALKERELAAKAKAEGKPTTPEAEPECPFFPRSAGDLNTQVLVGPSHGDLHARNVVVGVAEHGINDRRLNFSAVFDYGNMGPSNVIVLDFVKFEIELKVRAYELVFDPGVRDEYTRAVHDFEWQLAQDTLVCAPHRGRHEYWPAYTHANPAVVRLREVLVAIRSQMLTTLLRPGGRGWEAALDEFFLFTSVYSVLPCFYDDYLSRPQYLIAVAIAGGVAAAAMTQVRARLLEEYRYVDRLVTGEASEIQPETGRWFGCGLIGYDAAILLLKRCWDSGDLEKRKAATAVSDELVKVFPLAIEVWRWHLQLHLETAPESVPELIRTARARFQEPSEEILCRFGRAWKDLGDKFRTATPSNPERARDHYQKAIGQYEEAYRIRRGHYPGVNVAALYFLVAATHPAGSTGRAKALADARAFAAQVRLSRNDPKQPWPVDGSDDPRVWHPATEAELLIFEKRWQESEAAYQAIRATAGEQKTMGTQVQRLVAAWVALGEDVPPPFRSFDPAQPQTLFGEAKV